MRILTKHAVLWTEMVVDETIAHADSVEDHLGGSRHLHEMMEGPVICQMGSNNPTLAGTSAAVVEDFGVYQEINLNCECPSDKVAHQREFGAALLQQPQLVADIMSSIQKGTNLPVSVKARIGVVDDNASSPFDLTEFIAILAPICRQFVLHARAVHLRGLSARQNRNVPPLDYPVVYDMCRRFPDCEFVINGGIRSLQQARLLCHGAGRNDDENDMDETHHAVPRSVCNAPYGSCLAAPATVPSNLRGCMMGRAATDNPSLFWDVDRYFYGMPDNPCQNRRQALEQYCAYLEKSYPRRCCDQDERVTYRFPPPNVVLVDDENAYCHICGPTYGGGVEDNASNQDETDAESISSLEEEEDVSQPDAKHDSPHVQKFKRRHPGQRMSSKVIGRALKPVPGLFFGMPFVNAFRRRCDELVRDTRIRNCGPGFVLRRAMEFIPDEFLDQAFVKTEDLNLRIT